MRAIHSILAIALLGAVGTPVARAGRAAQDAASPQAGAAAQSLLSPGTTIDANLSTTLDAKKNKPGDRVEARAAEDVKQDGKVVLKKGTTLVGHVTDVQAHTKDQPQSQLAIVFDRVAIKKGEETPLSLTVQALAAPPVSASASGGSDEDLSGGLSSNASAAAAGGGVFGDSSSAVSGTAAPVISGGGSGGGSNSGVRSAGAVGGYAPSGRLASNSSGVFGMEGLSLRNVAASGASASTVITSPTKDVHLNGGTQILLTVGGQ